MPITPPIFTGSVVGEIEGHPNLVRLTNCELPIQYVDNDHSRLAPMPSMTAFVTDLCGDTGQAGQACSTVL